MFAPTQLFWYKLLFMVELLVADALFSFRFKRRSFFVVRVCSSAAVCLAAALFFPIVQYNAVYCSFMFLFFFVLSLITLKFCFNEPMINVLFSGIAGYATQHIAYEMYDLIVTAGDIGAPGFYGDAQTGLFPSALNALVYGISYIVCYWLSFVFFALKIPRNEDLELKNHMLLFLLVMVILVDIVMSLVLTFHAQENADRTFMAAVCIYNIACCWLVLIIQFEFFVRRRLEKQLALSNQIRYKEKQQYLDAKENVTLINEKCHDLKYQIRSIGAHMRVNERALDEITEIVSIYDSTVKTGNETLDVILTEKSLQCNKNGIELSCMVDGKELAFMAEDDIFSLFGNLIDNAIEAVTGLDEGMRSIGLTVKRSGAFLSVNIHNYYRHELHFVDGVPVTTKTVKDYHGFGFKSIKRICSKYDGELDIRAENGVFNVNILFQLREESAGGEDESD